MKPKIVYASLAALIVIIAISIFLSIESAKMQPVSQELKPQQTAAQQQSAFSDYTLEPPSLSDNRFAITVIETLPNKKPTPASLAAAEAREEEEKQARQKRRQEESAASLGQGPVFSEEPAGPPNQPAPGIPKSSKQPSDEEDKEMNARGIVMY